MLYNYETTILLTKLNLKEQLFNRTWREDETSLMRFWSAGVVVCFCLLNKNF